jgi:ankyrin repeat protein
LETSHTVMLQSILYQLLDQEHRLYVIFRDRYRTQYRSKGPKFEWETQDLIDILNALARIELNLKVYIVLDAMDESDGPGRPEILDTMMTLCSTSSQCIIKGLVATRPLPKRQLEQRFKESLHLVLEEKNRRDIENIVDRDLQRLIKDVTDDDQDISPTVFDGIKWHIIDRADGVFLWVSLVLKEVKTLVADGFSAEDLKRLHKILPRELEDLYKLIIQRLAESLPEHHIKEGRKLLAWATFSLRPLTVEELQDAIVVPSILETAYFEPRPDQLNRRIALLERRIQLTCGDLLEVKRPFVQLLHESVREFLLRKDKMARPFDLDKENGDAEIASICTRYLRLSLSQHVLEEHRVSTESVELWESQDYERFVRLLNDRPMLDYALSSLPKHLKSTKSSGVSDEYHSFLVEAMAHESARYFLSGTLTLPGEEAALASQTAVVMHFRIKALIAAAKGGHLKAIIPLITTGTNVNCIDEETGVFPLLAAVMKGHKEVAALLIDLHADCNAKDRYGETALHKAAARGQVVMVQLPLEHNAYVDVVNLEGERPLYLAAIHGHRLVADTLLHSLSDVDGGDRYRGTPLHRAAANGHQEVAELLLHSGAYVNANAEYGGTPLHRAVDNRHEAMVRLLLEGGASVNKASSYGGTALHCASASGQEAITSLLLQHKADVNAKDRYGWRPLDWARANGHEAIRELLLGNGADTGTNDQNDDINFSDSSDADEGEDIDDARRQLYGVTDPWLRHTGRD